MRPKPRTRETSNRHSRDGSCRKWCVSADVTCSPYYHSLTHPPLMRQRQKRLLPNLTHLQLPRYILHPTQHSISDNRICRERPSASPVSESTTFLRVQCPSRRLRVALPPHAGNPHRNRHALLKPKSHVRRKHRERNSVLTVEPEVDVAADPTAKVYSSWTCG